MKNAVKESNTSVTVKRKEIDQDTQKLINVLESADKPYHEKLAIVKHEIEESVRQINFNYTIPGFLEDAAYALHRAVESVHGFTAMKDKKSASGSNPPEMLDVRFSDGTRIKVPFGQINLPQFGDDAYISMGYDYGDHMLHIEGTCEKRYAILMDQIMDKTQEILSTDSIYKNKAIKYDGNDAPHFIDLSSVNTIEHFMTPLAKYATEPIEARIERSAECLEKGIDLKFGVLLEGSYGTGKTLYANKLAYKAIQNGWTFIYCAKPENTLKVLQMANTFTKNGKGVVLFIEDIDKVLNTRNRITNEISLLMDGSETKHNNIISIFSTNHIEKIDPTFLRGKRIGSIVTLEHLDADTAEEMLNHYLGEYLVGPIKNAAQKIEEFKIVPAFVSEIIDGVKTRAVLKDTQDITEEDILNSIKQYKRQMDMAKIKTIKETDGEIYMRLHKKFIEESCDTAINENDMIDRINENV